jgi:DNA-binding CsgD family transcriptional regulator
MAGEFGDLRVAYSCRTLLAELAADRGARDEVEEHLQLARACASRPVEVAWVDVVRGFAELADGAYAAAAERFEAAWRAHPEMVALGSSDLWLAAVEAYVRLGRTADARLRLDELAREKAQYPHDEAQLAFGRALLAPPDELDASFAAALAVRERIGRPFWLARTRLAYGERLRRAGRRVDARAQLEPALAAFEALGAHPWAARAAAELRATGARVRARRDGAGADLSAQELQVALCAARGLSNREIAAELFVSVKTVEKHLTAAYDKLGLRSRAQLARLFAERGAAGGGDALGRAPATGRARRTTRSRRRA